MANVGNCPKCKQPNEYSKVVCDFCGARLPWADAFQKSRKEAAPPSTSAPGPVPPQTAGQPVAQLPYPSPQGSPPGYPPQGSPPPGYPSQGNPTLPSPPGYPPQAPPQPTPAPGYGPPQAGMPAYGQICERCGHVGNPVSKTEGSFAIEFLLWFFFCLPGIIYSIWRLTTRKPVCPRCQGGMLPLASPGGASLYARFYNGQAPF